MGAPAAPKVASGSEYSGTRGTGGVGSQPAVAHCVVGVGKAAPSDLTVYEYCATPVRLTVEDMPRARPETGGMRGGAGGRYTLQSVCTLAGVPPGVVVSW